MRRMGALTAIAALLFGVLQFAAAPSAAAITLPVGFSLVDYSTGQRAFNLTNFAWLEDGGLLASGKDGTITFIPAGGSPRLLTKVPSVRVYGDHGLLGFALANDYSTTGRVYVTYDKGDPSGAGFGMVEEWKASPAASPTSFTKTKTIIDGEFTSPQLVQAGATHAIDTVVVAPDDTLFISIGDDSNNNGDPKALRAQDLNQPYGKILQLTADGRGVTTNPLFRHNSQVMAKYGLYLRFAEPLPVRSGPSVRNPPRSRRGMVRHRRGRHSEARNQRRMAVL